MKVLKFILLYTFSKDFRDYITQCRQLASAINQKMEQNKYEDTKIKFNVGNKNQF